MRAGNAYSWHKVEHYQYETSYTYSLSDRLTRIESSSGAPQTFEYGIGCTAANTTSLIPNPRHWVLETPDTTIIEIGRNTWR